MKFVFSTLSGNIRRIQPLRDAVKELSAIDLAFERLGQELGADDVVVIEQPVPHTFENRLEEILKALRPDITAVEMLEKHDRKVCLMFCTTGCLSVDITQAAQTVALRRIFKAVI